MSHAAEPTVGVHDRVKVLWPEYHGLEAQEYYGTCIDMAEELSLYTGRKGAPALSRRYRVRYDDGQALASRRHTPIPPPTPPLALLFTGDVGAA